MLAAVVVVVRVVFPTRDETVTPPVAEKVGPVEDDVPPVRVTEPQARETERHRRRQFRRPAN